MGSWCTPDIAQLQQEFSSSPCRFSSLRPRRSRNVPTTEEDTTPVHTAVAIPVVTERVIAVARTGMLERAINTDGIGNAMRTRLLWYRLQQGRLLVAAGSLVLFCSVGFAQNMASCLSAAMGIGDPNDPVRAMAQAELYCQRQQHEWHLEQQRLEMQQLQLREQQSTLRQEDPQLPQPQPLQLYASLPLLHRPLEGAKFLQDTHGDLNGRAWLAQTPKGRLLIFLAFCDGFNSIGLHLDPDLSNLPNNVDGATQSNLYRLHRAIEQMYRSIATDKQNDEIVNEITHLSSNPKNADLSIFCLMQAARMSLNGFSQETVEASLEKMRKW
jgi:hypothetical protein